MTPHPRSVLLRDTGWALLLLALALISVQLPFLTIDGSRVLWMGGALVVGVLAVLPTWRWPVFVGLFAVGAAASLVVLDWPASTALVRVALDVVVVLGAGAAFRRTRWLTMTTPSAVWGTLAVGAGSGLVRGLGTAALATLLPSAAVTGAAKPAVIVLSTTLGILTSAALVACLVAEWPRRSRLRDSADVVGRVSLVLGALLVVLVLAGPVFGDVRVGVLLFPVLAYAALTLPGAVLAALLVIASGGSVAVSLAYLPDDLRSASGIAGSSAALTVLPLVGLALMSWIIHSVAVSERRASRRITAIMDSLLDPHLLMTPVRDGSGTVVDFLIVEANEAGAVDHAVPRDVLIGSRLSEVAPSEVEMGMVPRYAAVAETGEPLVLDGHAFIDDARGGEVRNFDLNAVRVAGGVVVTWRDVTDREEEAAALAQREQQYRLLAENAMDLVFYVTPDDRIAWVSPSITASLGHDPTDLIGANGHVLVHPEDISAALNEAERQGWSGVSSAVRLRLRSVTGDYRWFEVTMRSIRDAAGVLTGGIVAARDVDAEVRASLELERELSYDALTGLARRSVAVMRIQDVLDGRQGRPWALLVAGVDRLTMVNTAYGFTAGDRVLQTVADRLVTAAGAHDRVARIAGDEFAIILSDLDDPTDAALAARVLLDAIRGPVDVGGAEVDVTACIGIAMADQRPAAALLADATAAMWQATAVGPDRWDFLDGNAGEESRLALARQSQVRVALSEQRIRAWFMPIVDLATGQVRGYEALARCVEPDGSIRPPAEFLPAAEASGSILDIDRVILEQSVSALAVLPPDVHVAVNVSSASLSVGGFPQWALGRLTEAGIAPGRLQLEVTETALVQVSAAVAQEMTEIAELGVGWWVDDFGTGFSSISHLRDLPIGGLKLDRSFTAAVHDASGRSARLAEGLAGLASGLGLLTVAEGVEDAVQAEVLAAQGWLLGQGYLFGQATPIERVIGVQA